MRLRRFLSREDGATAVEYGLMLALIAAVIVGAVTLLGGDVTAIFQDMVDRWP
ncbi:MAG: Flp family type IVb pilin [Actinomycetota bacterium]